MQGCLNFNNAWDASDKLATRFPDTYLRLKGMSPTNSKIIWSHNDGAEFIALRALRQMENSGDSI